MLYQKQSDKMPKKINQKISKFNYYLDTLFPELFNLNTNSLNLQEPTQTPSNQLLTKQGQRNLIYNYFHSHCQNTALIDSNSILSSVKKLYLNQDVIKINQLSYSRESLFKQSYLPVYGFFSEIIDFVLIVNNLSTNKPETIQKTKQVTTNNKLTLKSHLNDSQNDPTSKNLKTQPKQYSLYVIHNCNSFNPTQNQEINKISWEYFIERYQFSDKPNSSLQNDERQSTIKYELVYCYKTNQSVFSFDNKLTQEFIKSHCKLQNGNLQNLQKLQGYLLQKSSEVQKNKKIQEDVAFSDQHKRQNKIPAEHYKHYLNLKKQVYKKYLEINSQSHQNQPNRFFYDNLICRYLIAKEYHFEQTRKSIFEYLRWQKQMKDKYPSIDSFKQIHEIGAYRYIGQDFLGRPVVLSKAALVDVTIMDQVYVERYCDYYIYFLQIYLRTKMRGYVDQMIVIGDLNNLSSRNFKLAITKRNVGDSLKYGPERQCALVTVNVSTFAYTAWTFIKPLLPKKTLHKIQIVGHNKKEIIDTLITRMDISIIPEYLGGQNQKHGDTSEVQNQVEFTQTKKMKKDQNDDENEDILDEYQARSVGEQPQKTQKQPSNSFVNLFESMADFIKVLKK